jgi:hypothetical protein
MKDSMKEELIFDRIAFSCLLCERGGVITAVWLSLTRVIVEGYCVHCNEIRQRCFDLLKSDAWLRGETESPDRGIEAVISSPTATNVQQQRPFDLFEGI